MQYLYLVKCQQFYKIGITNDIKGRVSQLATGNPFELEVLAVFRFKSANSVEEVLHQRFANKRERGEWFNLDSQQIESVHQICQLLGGKACELPTVEYREDEEMSKIPDGWRIEVTHGGKFWQWRERKRGGKVRYGGKFRELPKKRQEEYYKRLKSE